LDEIRSPHFSMWLSIIGGCIQNCKKNKNLNAQLATEIPNNNLLFGTYLAQNWPQWQFQWWPMPNNCWHLFGSRSWQRCCRTGWWPTRWRRWSCWWSCWSWSRLFHLRKERLKALFFLLNKHEYNKQYFFVWYEVTIQI